MYEINTKILGEETNSFGVPEIKGEYSQHLKIVPVTHFRRDMPYTPLEAVPYHFQLVTPKIQVSTVRFIGVTYYKGDENIRLGMEISGLICSHTTTICPKGSLSLKKFKDSQYSILKVNFLRSKKSYSQLVIKPDIRTRERELLNKLLSQQTSLQLEDIISKF